MRGLRFIVYSHIWIGLAVAAFITSTYLIYDQKPDWKIILIGFFATILTYNFQRIIRLKTLLSDNPLINWIINNRRIIRVFTVISACFLGYVAFLIQLETLLLCAGLAVISMLYAYPFLRRTTSLRDIPTLKIFLITVTWTGAACLPFAELEYLPESTFVLFLAERALFILAITIPFDIRDINLDSQAKHTIPQMIGIRAAKWLALFLLAGHVVLAYFAYDDPVFTACLVNALLTGILIAGSRTNRGEMYYTGLIDSTPITQVLLIAFIG